METWLPPSSLVENRPRCQCSTSSKLQSPNELEKPVRGLFMAKFFNFLWAGRYFPLTRDIYWIYRDILKCRDILKHQEFIAIFWWRYITGSFDSRYIADICNYGPNRKKSPSLPKNRIFAIISQTTRVPNPLVSLFFKKWQKIQAKRKEDWASLQFLWER